MTVKPDSDPHIRVLLIDDDEDDYLLTRDIVAEIPGGRYKLDWEADFDRALDLICRNEYDAYLIDFRLGAKTGLDLLKEKQDRNCSGPVILLTGAGQSDIDRMAEEAGADDFLEKSRLDSVLLDRCIRYAMRQQNYKEELERKVTERTAELAAANARLVEADRRKDEFLATLAHELRNPLAPIRNALEIMKLAGQNPAALDRPRQVVERQTAHMVRLIDDLLDASRISRNNLRINLEPIDLREPLKIAIETSEPQILQAGLELKVEIPDGELPVSGDLVRLCQLFTNLLTNAAKYTERDGNILLAVEKACSTVVVRVKDTGVGIAEEMLPEIFNMFSQVNETINRSRGGMGIGLALVKRLAELHGGTVHAHSDGLGKGSEFVVSLPLSDTCGCEKCSEKKSSDCAE
jgi:signal transduction histidine kinase